MKQFNQNSLLKSISLAFLFLILSSFINLLPKEEYVKEIKAFQESLNSEYLDSEKSILSKKQRKKLKKNKGHNFFSINEEYRIVAKFDRNLKKEEVKIKTSSDQVRTYEIYGKAHFNLKGKSITLNIYQNPGLLKKEEYKDYLFLPYRDHTSGKTSYGGGRYIDLRITDSDSLVIDFNKSYHPYCAYTTGYSCPIPPAENYMDLKIEAGIKNIDLK